MTVGVGGGTIGVGGEQGVGGEVQGVGGAEIGVGGMTWGVGGMTWGVGGSDEGQGGTDGEGGAGEAEGGAEPGVGGSDGVGGVMGNGGTTDCDWSDPPTTGNIAAWVEESWNAQLGGNIRGREAWLLDNVMKGEGEINICVRWGATSAPNDVLDIAIDDIPALIQGWFNDWYSQLDGYGCFPYPSVSVKITGWAVRPGNESWVESEIDPATTKIYTEVDGSNEPKCPDNCSFFSNWDHVFGSCDGGAEFHHDYWFWIDDTTNAAAEGGDWGLRMPVASLNNACNRVPYDVNTVEHEMGHGFGFQDYYEDWTGIRPDESLMTLDPMTLMSPSLADRWLLRRAWKESKELRGW